MPEKLEKIRQRAVVVKDEPDDSSVKLEVMKEINRFNKQFKELQLGSENTCRKKQVGPIPFCKEVKAWVDRRNLLH